MRRDNALPAGVFWCMPRGLALVVFASCLALVNLTGCARQQPPVAGPPPAAVFSVSAADYADTFEVARAELLRRRFELERVDAQAGVILTQPEGGAGLLAPWTMGPGARVVEDTLNAQSRTVEIRFEAAEAAAAPPRGSGAALADPRLPVSPGQAQESVLVSVRVLVSRRVTPTRRLDPSGIRYSLNAVNPQLFRRGLGTTYTLPQDLDARASVQIARSIQARLGELLGRRDPAGGAPNQGGPRPDTQLAVQ